MAKWLRELNLLPEWRMAQDQEIAPQEMASVISTRLSALEPFEGQLDVERKDLADRFGDFARDDAADVEEFDGIMSDLYDWADTHITGNFFNAQKACWVRTF